MVTFMQSENGTLHEDVTGQIFEGLERLCVTPESNRILSAPAYPGIERIQAQFRGDAFELKGARVIGIAGGEGVALMRRVVTRGGRVTPLAL